MRRGKLQPYCQGPWCYSYLLTLTKLIIFRQTKDKKWAEKWIWFHAKIPKYFVIFCLSDFVAFCLLLASTFHFTFGGGQFGGHQPQMSSRGSISVIKAPNLSWNFVTPISNLQQTTKVSIVWNRKLFSRNFFFQNRCHFPRSTHFYLVAPK